MKLLRRGLGLILSCILILGMAAAETTDGMPEFSLNAADYKWPLLPGELGIQAGERVAADYFDDAVFVGDSVTLKLYLYAKEQRKKGSECLGKAQFLAVGSMSSANLLGPINDKSVHPTYQGTKMRLEEAIRLMGAKKVYIMLGINDVSAWGVDKSVENMCALIDVILEQSPEAEIFVESATPRISTKDTAPRTRSLFEFDLKMYAACVERGWNYVDVAAVMRDKYGYLIQEYCSDAGSMGLHLNDAGCRAWVEYLETHGKEDAK